jgi:DNA polymerase-3 subunit epsilon
MKLFLDTETSGLPLWKEPSEHPGQPRIVSLAAMLHDDNRKPVRRINTLIKPDGWVIGEDTIKIHGITNERARAEGRPIGGVLKEFLSMLDEANVVIGHNVSFDLRMIRIETKRRHIEVPERETYCTMKKSMELCDIRPTEAMLYAGFVRPKNPKLTEAYQILFGKELDGAHSAMADMEACAEIYYHLKDQGI